MFLSLVNMRSPTHYSRRDMSTRVYYYIFIGGLIAGDLISPLNSY